MLLSNFFAKFNQELDEFNENIDKDLD